MDAEILNHFNETMNRQESAFARVHQLIADGKPHEAVDVYKAYSAEQASRGSAMDLLRTARTQAGPAVESTFERAVPKGIGAGKIAAYVAGIGLLAAAGKVLYDRHRANERSWAERIDQESQNQMRFR